MVETHLSYVPYFDGENAYRHIGVQSEQTFTVNIHADMVKIKANQFAGKPPKSTRDKVSSFSRKSRKRMMELMADEIRVPDLFVTLTFDDSYVIGWEKKFRADFEAFRRRLERAYGSISAIWRLELETRKSGEYKGVLMPHFHLIVWLPDPENQVSLIVEKKESHHWAQWWHDITGCTHPEHLKRRGCDISRIRSRRHGYHYVSKYATKSSDDRQTVGRRWGRIGRVGQGSRAGVVLNKSEYIQLKRLITTYHKRLITRKNKDTGKWEAKRNKLLASKTARQSPELGLMAFGLGVWKSPDFHVDKSTIWKMINHAIELASDNQ